MDTILKLIAIPLFMLYTHFKEFLSNPALIIAIGLASNISSIFSQLSAACILALLTDNLLVSAGLLGAGEGAGSCAAPPFRAERVFWRNGCPSYAEVRLAD